LGGWGRLNVDDVGRWSKGYVFFMGSPNEFVSRFMDSCVFTTLIWYLLAVSCFRLVGPVTRTGMRIAKEASRLYQR